MSKDVRIANIHGFILFEGTIRLASVARLSNPSDVSYQVVPFSSVLDLMVAFIS